MTKSRYFFDSRCEIGASKASFGAEKQRLRREGGEQASDRSGGGARVSDRFRSPRPTPRCRSSRTTVGRSPERKGIFGQPSSQARTSLRIRRAARCAGAARRSKLVGRARWSMTSARGEPRSMSRAETRPTVKPASGRRGESRAAINSLIRARVMAMATALRSRRERQPPASV